MKNDCSYNFSKLAFVSYAGVPCRIVVCHDDGLLGEMRVETEVQLDIVLGVGQQIIQRIRSPTLNEFDSARAHSPVGAPARGEVSKQSATEL
jgi:hypothetical protein